MTKKSIIIIVHHANKVVEIKVDNEIINVTSSSIIKCFYELAGIYKDCLILWVKKEFKNFLNFEYVNNIFHHDLIMASYNISKIKTVSEYLGYIDRNPFLNVKYNVAFPTWLMSSDVGGINAQVINKSDYNNFKNDSFDYFLNSFAKLAINQGLFCYSDPRLTKNYTNSPEFNTKKEENLIFKFVKEHYSTKKLFILFLIIFWEEKRVTPFLNFFSLIFVKKRNFVLELNKINIISNLEKVSKNEIDVIIPSLGRKDFVYNLMTNLRNQTHLPKKVIIIEQNPDLLSKSELVFLKEEKWPFLIEHVFIHKTGACNARNIGIQHIISDWVFLCDDDNGFDKNLLEKSFINILKYGIDVLNTVYITSKEIEKNFNIKQGTAFGTGNAILKSDILKKINFDLNFEHGYGEDVDFGMRLRNSGYDVIYFPNLIINHFKANYGGFRTLKIMPWSDDEIQPKPSPTVMLFNLTHLTKEQLVSFKFKLMIKYYSSQQIKNPILYFNYFNKQWERSSLLANKLKQEPT